MATIDQLAVKALRAGSAQIQGDDKLKPEELKEGLLDYAMKAVQVGLTTYEGLSAGANWWKERGDFISHRWGKFKEGGFKGLRASRDESFILHGSLGDIERIDARTKIEEKKIAKRMSESLEEETRLLNENPLEMIDDDGDDYEIDFSKYGQLTPKQERMFGYSKIQQYIDYLESSSPGDPSYTGDISEEDKLMTESLYGERPSGAYWDFDTNSYVDSAGNPVKVDKDGEPMTGFPVVEPPGYVSGEAWRFDDSSTREYPSGPKEHQKWTQRAKFFGVTYREYQGNRQMYESSLKPDQYTEEVTPFDTNIPTETTVADSTSVQKDSTSVHMGILEDSRVSMYLSGTNDTNVNTDGDYVVSSMMDSTNSKLDDPILSQDYKGTGRGY